MINIIDASNLERNLYLTTQLLEIGVPMVIALNMMDMVRKNGDRIDVKKLSDALGCQIIETSAVKGEGSTEVAKAALNLAQSKAAAPKPLKFNDKLENILARIARLLQGACQPQNLRWYSIKLFERDEKAIEQLKLSPAALEEIEGLRQEAEKEFDDDVESIITHERYVVIADLLKTCYRKQSKQKLTTSDKIDKIVTNRILALPIFAVVMFLIYYISITTVGTMMTDWVNDVLFGEIIPPAVEGLLVSIGTADWLQSLILDGIVAGCRRGAGLPAADAGAVPAPCPVGGLRLHVPYRLHHGPHLPPLRPLRQVVHPHADRSGLRRSCRTGKPHHRERPRPQDDHYDHHLHPPARQSSRSSA